VASLRGLNPLKTHSAAHHKLQIHCRLFTAYSRNRPKSVLAYKPHRTPALSLRYSEAVSTLSICATNKFWCTPPHALQLSLSTMSIKTPPSDLPTYSFSSADEFEAFLDREHTTAPGFYLKMAKKSSGIPSVSAAEAVEIALCFGWIDGRANGLDNHWWLVRYTPRRSKSIWSQKNVNTMGRLLEEGRVRPAGVAAAEVAKADGRWKRAYAGPATITVPDDLAIALAAESAAASFFEGMKKTDRYPVLLRVQIASPQSRAKRIEALVQMLAEGKRPGASAKPAVKPKRNANMKKANTRRAAVKQGSGRRQLGSAHPVQDDQARRPRRAGLRRRP
jgi:uncharacterized protein YdeI (YjbR/CyaY-like superfamily)